MKKSKKIAFSAGIALAIGVINYTGIHYYINSKVDPVTVAYAKDDIPPNTKITKEMVIERSVPSSSLPPEAMVAPSSVIGKYTANNFGISKHSLFYKGKVMAAEKMPNSSVLKLKSGELAFPLLVDLETSLGNSILPDTKVDLFFRGKVETVQKVNGSTITVEKPIYGRIAKGVRVTSVKDTDATNVFSDTKKKQNGGFASPTTGEGKTALAKIYTFAVDEQINEVLNKATLLGEIRPVATGSEELDTTISDDDIVSWIEGQSFQSASPNDLVTKKDGDQE